MAGPSKRVRYGDSDYDETLLKWYEEENDSGSDIDDISPDFNIESEHDSNSEISEIEDCSESEEIDDEDSAAGGKSYIYGKNRYRWCTSEVRPSSRTRKHNIVIKVPILKAKAKELGDNANPLSVWNLLFSDNILKHIVQNTNHKLSAMRVKYSDNSKHHLRETDIIEMNAFLGLLVYTSVFNSNHENIDRLFATDGTGREIFRSDMSKKRFAILLASIRFDNPDDREERKKVDPTAAISFIFNSFIHNCQSVYGLGQSVTIDEMLVSFRGRCRFKMYMPNKPAKYGIKIQCLTDARNSYLYNAYIYSGKNSDGMGINEEYKKLLKPTQAVLRLAEPIFNSSRNITADNWYSSIQLVDILRTKNLTYVGTMKKNKAEIPPSFLPNRTRAEGSTLYGFREEYTLISHVGKVGKATVLISSQHDRRFTDPTKNKPEIITYYNENKGGVDSLDEKCSKSSSSRRTRRWPLVIFFRILDISIINSYILHQCYKNNPYIKEKSVFALELAKQLVQVHMRRRLTYTNIPRELRQTIKRILGAPEEEEFTNTGSIILEKRKICSLCPSKKRRMTRYLCLHCKKPVCLECTKPVCNNCS